MGTNAGSPMWEQVVQDTCAQIQFQYGCGNPLGVDASRYLAQVFAYTSVLALDLLPDCASTHGDVISWLRAYKGEIDVRDFGEYLKRADSELKAYVGQYDELAAKGNTWSYERFKRSVKPGLHSRHLAIARPLLEKVLQDCDPHAFRAASTWINFLRRCNLPGLDLTEQCEAEYVAFEADMATWSYDLETVKALNAIVLEWFSDFSCEVFHPKHGPGSVAGATGALPHFLKYEDCVVSDYLLDYVQRDIGPLEGWIPSSSTSLAENCYTAATKLVHGAKMKRVSELVCVPKSIITNRTISKEPAFLQYLQQGYKACVVDHIRRHPYLSRHIDFSRQDLSKDMAQTGSILGDLATIDLSSASDSVTTELVKGVFAHTGPLLRGLICTRSKATVLPSGRVLPLKKFAPMGSALCFPVETIIFAACCELAIRRWRSDLRALYGELEYSRQAVGHELAQARGVWRVYGDDIIIASGAVEHLLKVLDLMHFKVNASKSYWSEGFTGVFREACGIEALDGFDVTPLRIPRFFRGITSQTMSSADGVVAAVSLANNAFDYGATRLRRMILNDMGDIHSLPFTTTGRLGIKTWDYCCTNYSTPSRQLMAAIGDEPCYQRLEHRVVVAVASRNCLQCSKYRRGTRFSTGKGDRCDVCSRHTRFGVTKQKRYGGRTTPINAIEHIDGIQGDPKSNFLLAGYETARYHEWLMSASLRKTDEEPDEGFSRLTGEPLSDEVDAWVYEELRKLATAGLRANEPVSLCPMRTQLKVRWVPVDDD